MEDGYGARRSYADVLNEQFTNADDRFDGQPRAGRINARLERLRDRLLRSLRTMRQIIVGPYLDGTAKRLARALGRTERPRRREKGSLNVALICSSWGQQNYGISVWKRNLAKALARRGHRVTIFAYTSQEASIADDGGVRVIALPPSPIRRWPALPDMWDWLVGWQRNVCASVLRMHAQNPFDVISGPLYPAEPLAVVRSAALPAVVSVHTTEGIVAAMGGASDQGSTALIEAERELLRTAPLLISNSRAAISDAVAAAEVMVEPSRYRIVPHGLPDRHKHSRAPDREGHLRILFIGSSGFRKGLDVFLLALVPLLQSSGVVVDIAGSRGDPCPVTGFMMRYKNEPWVQRIQLHGIVTDQEKDALLAAANIVVQPSRYESFGLVAVEAMMFGKPVISTRVGGIPEVVEDGVTGILVPPGDAEALAAAMRRLVEDAALRARMGAAGRERYLARFTDTAMADAWVAAVREGLVRQAERQ